MTYARGPRPRGPLASSFAATAAGIERSGANVRKRLSVLIDADLIARLESVKARTGLSDAEQIRQAVRLWLETRDWPLHRSASPDPVPDD